VNTKPSKFSSKNGRSALKSSKKDDSKSGTSDGSTSALREEHLFDDDVFRPVKGQPAGNEALRLKPNAWDKRPSESGRARKEAQRMQN
jgi:hypothetical protein